MSAWSVALRVARRDAWRSRGRSSLVLAMIALPVLGLTAVDVVVRTYDLTPEQEAVRVLGQADLRLSDSGQATIVPQPPPYGGYATPNGGSVPRDPVDPASVLPAGSRTLPDSTAYGRVSGPGRGVDADLRSLSYDDPLATGIYRQAAGRAPAAPGEVALTTHLAERLGVGVGDTVTTPTGPGQVVGTVHDGRTYDADALLRDPVPGSPVDALLVALPQPLTWDFVEQAGRSGMVVDTARRAVPGSPPVADGSFSTVQDSLPTIGLVVGMALLEVVLLAGPAFAVGAKRQERVLALLSATGAERSHVRRVVLAGGVVLGAVAGAVGILAGTGVAAALLPLVPRIDRDVPGPFDLRPLELLGLAAVGAGTALLAAVLPAINAGRQDVLASLTGRRGVRRASLKVPLAGLLVAAAGTVIALRGARSRDINVILAGAALAELGLVATTPALVGLAGRLGPLLPAAPRLALRDAARNRSRTAPAVAAVLAAVAGSVAVGTYVASLDRNDRDAYEPSAASGAVTVQLSGEDAARLGDVSRLVGQAVPGAGVQPLRAVGDGSLSLATAADRLCPPGVVPSSTTSCVMAGASYGATLYVGGPELAAAMDGVTDPALTAVLLRGGVLADAGSVEPDGTATLLVLPDGATDSSAATRVRVPAAALPTGSPQRPVISEQALALTGKSAQLQGLIALGPDIPSQAQQDSLTEAVADIAPGATVQVERGYVSNYGVGLLALLAGSAVLVLGASGIATGLAAADGRADLSTLAAIGASPGLRRRLAGSQSLVTAGLGSLLGVAAGLVPAIGLIRAVNAPDSTGYQRAVPFPLVIPWTNLAVALVVVPLLAGLLAALATRSRLPLVRRVA